MSDFHARIMNIQGKSDDLLYKTGHRDARHAAAEIVLEVEPEITRLTARAEATENEAKFWRGKASEFQFEIVRLNERTARAEAAEERAGNLRMCVACGRMEPADEVGRGDDLPDCASAGEYSACTFDMTPQEAWQHWKGKATGEMALRLAAEAERDRLREALEAVRDDCHLRAVPNRRGVQAVPLGRGVWDQVCAALKGEDG